MSHNGFRKLALSAAVLLGAASTARANIIFNPQFESSITGDPNAAAIETAINNAIAFYTANITTNITVNIAFAEMTSGLGESDTFILSVPYSTYITDLHNSSSGDSTDTTALAGLPISVTDPVNGGSTITATFANLNAIGDPVTTPTGDPCPGGTLSGNFNACIQLNTSLTSPPQSLSGNYYLQSVVQHEIDEVLGLGSGLVSGRRPGIPHPEDLFRYNGSGNRSYSNNSCTSPPAAYFSLNGVTDIHAFNNCNNGGDYGDWASTSTPFVQDAFGTPGATPSLSLASPEAVALDAIGYNFIGQTGTPEPGTMGLISLSLALLGAAAYRRKKRALT
jgi:hypothetical protein